MSVEGTVTLDGTPAEGLLVEMVTYDPVDNDDGYGGGLSQVPDAIHGSDVTDVNGVFRIEDEIPSEQCRRTELRVRHSSPSQLLYATARPADCGVHAGQNLDVRTQLLEWSGFVRSGGVPAQGAIVQAAIFAGFDPNPPIFYPRRLFAGTLTDSLGAYALTVATTDCRLLMAVVRWSTSGDPVQVAGSLNCDRRTMDFNLPAP